VGVFRQYCGSYSNSCLVFAVFYLVCTVLFIVSFMYIYTYLFCDQPRGLVVRVSDY